jgi:hypothetical protein
MRKTDIYLGGEDIDENEMLPKDFADLLRSFITDILGRRK